jgi:hypothetical protein
MDDDDKEDMLAKLEALQEIIEDILEDDDIDLSDFLN